MSENAANNGVNVDALIAAREALTNAPEAAQFKWRAACEWKNGTHSHSTVEGFYGLGGEQYRKTTFKFDADHPECFASEDKGATPVEYVLVGLEAVRIRKRFDIHGAIDTAVTKLPVFWADKMNAELREAFKG